MSLSVQSQNEKLIKDAVMKERKYWIRHIENVLDRMTYQPCCSFCGEWVSSDDLVHLDELRDELLPHNIENREESDEEQERGQQQEHKRSPTTHNTDNFTTKVQLK